MGKVKKPTAAKPRQSAAVEAVLTLAEAAAYLRVAEAALEADAAAGRVPGRRVGGAWRFHRPGLARWLARGRRATRAARTVVEFVVPDDGRPRAFPLRPTHPKLAAEHDAFERLLPDLMKQHPGRYVAIDGGVVVAVAKTEIDALNQACAADPTRLPLVRLVTDQPQPLPRIRGLRVPPAAAP